MKKRIEFPLLEMILIVIILLVWAFFALPKFMDVGSEARIKTLNATALNIDAINRLLYSRAVIHGVQKKQLQATDIFGEKDAGAFLVYGELRAQEKDLKHFIDNTLIEYAPTKKVGEVLLSLNSYKNDRCYIIYKQAKRIESVESKTSIQKATYRIKSTGC